MKRTREIGFEGEDVACEFLESLGFDILQRNFLTRHGEIDIIAENEGYIVFAEVKMRSITPSSQRYGRPALAVTKEKIQNIIHSAKVYLLKHKTTKSIRFDVIELYAQNTEHGNIKYHLKHLPSAFTLNDAR